MEGNVHVNLEGNIFYECLTQSNGGVIVLNFELFS